MIHSQDLYDLRVQLGAAMRVTHLSVSNHSGIPDLDIEVRDHLVVVGPNESGKSSLLSLLDAVLAGGTPRLYTVIDSESLRDLDDELEVEVTFESTSPEDLVAFADELEAIADGQYRLRLRVTASVDAASDEMAIERPFVKPGFSKSAGTSRLQYLGWTFLPASRSPDRELGSGRSSALRALLKAVELGDSREEIERAIDALHDVIAGAAPLETLRGSWQLRCRNSSREPLKPTTLCSSYQGPTRMTRSRTST